MGFKVTKQYPRGKDAFCAEFADLNAAKKYVIETLGAEAAMNIAVVYRIYEWDELVEEFDASKLPAKSGQAKEGEGEGSQGAGGKGSQASFRPTPFNTTPRPAGSPQNWIKDEGEDDKDKEDKG